MPNRMPIMEISFPGLSFYSFRSKSIFRVIVAFFGLIMSIGGILVSVMTVIFANKLIQAGVV